MKSLILNRIFRSVLLAGFLSVMTLSTANAQFGKPSQGGGTGGTGKIDVTADKLSSENSGNTIEASGNVEIKRDLTILKAEEVRINRGTQDIDAKGKASLSEPGLEVKSADSIQFNLEKETGEIQNGDLFLEEGHISMMGRRLQKLEGQSYHIDDGFFTTCLCEPGSRPPWKVSADEMTLDLDGLGIVRNAYLYVLDVPVAYFPYAFLPLRKERQTGFLIPKIGQSGQDGFRFQSPFFWAISKSTDATVAFDVETKARAGLWGQFRTIIERDADVQLNAAYFNEVWRKNANSDIVDPTTADQNIPKNRWSIIGSHRYTTATDWLTYSDFAAYGDGLFARELSDRLDLPISLESKSRVARYGASRMGVFKGWTDTFVKSELKFYQDFIQYPADTLQRTPQVAFWGRRFLADFPLELRWHTEGINYLARRGGDGLRFDLQPELVVPFNFSSFLFGAFSVAPRETAYHLYTPVKPGVHNVSRELVEIRSNVGTSFSRVFGWSGLGVSGLKHVIEPEISYLFIPGVNQSSIPIMDDVDRVNRRNIVTFALANRLWGKLSGSPFIGSAADRDVENLSAIGATDVRELAALKLALSYDVDAARRGADSLTDVDINLRFAPATYINMTLDGGITPGAWNITQARATMSMSDPRPLGRRSLDADFNRANSMGVSYSFLRAGPNGFLSVDANDNLDAPLGTPVPPSTTPSYCTQHPTDPRCPGGFSGNIAGGLSGNFVYHLLDNVMVSFNTTYDILNNKYIGFNAATKLLSSCECWAVTLSVGQNINPAKTSFNFNFNLLGLGSSQSTLR
jgi:LPS-assembly protein